MVAVTVSPLVALRHGGASLVDGVSVTKASANAKRSSGRASGKALRWHGERGGEAADRIDRSLSWGRRGADRG